MHKHIITLLVAGFILPVALMCQDSSAGAPAQTAAPLQLRIGSATITPVGFAEFTTVFRTTNTGAGISTGFGSIPYSNSAAGNLTEFRPSAQHSRIGIRVDSKYNGTNILVYMEADFLGALPGTAAVTSNSGTLRVRHYWVDLRKNKWEAVAGQSWSLLTPNRKGLSPLSSDVFTTQAVDTNYQAGLVFSRNPQFRVIYHPSGIVALGVSLENPDQYIGGLVTLPAAFSGNNYSNELNNGTTGYSAPNLHPDVIGKIAFDPKLPNGHAFHFEVAGLLRSFRLFNPLTSAKYSASGMGGSVNLNYEVFKNFRLLTNNYYSYGGGRMIGGLAPDLIVRADGSPSPVHSGSTVSGFEAQAGNTQIYGYYGGVYIPRNVAIDMVSGKPTPVGYGYAGSPNSHNRSIQEITGGLTRTFWKDPQYGALQLMSQYSYILRSPWSVASGTPANAHLSMVFLALRYTLPGSAPTVKY